MQATELTAVPAARPAGRCGRCLKGPKERGAKALFAAPAPRGKGLALGFTHPFKHVKMAAGHVHQSDTAQQRTFLRIRSDAMRGERKKVRITVAVGVTTLFAAFFAFDLGQHLTLDHFKAHQHDFQQLYAENKALTLGGYFLLYVALTALSLPGASVLTLAAGALFGFLPALLIVSFAASIGATLAFLISRLVLRGWVQARFGRRLRAVKAGVEREGAFYLFTLRLVPLFPFWLINLVMGLSPIRTSTFYLVSQIGMLPGAMLYVNAGTRLGQIERMGDILSPGLIVSFALLGIFPLAARKGVEALKSRRAPGGHAKPKKFDYTVVVIGAASAPSPRRCRCGGAACRIWTRRSRSGAASNPKRCGSSHGAPQ